MDPPPGPAPALVRTVPAAERPPRGTPDAPLLGGLRAFLRAQADLDASEDPGRRRPSRAARAADPSARPPGGPRRAANAASCATRSGEAGRMLDLLDGAMDRLPESLRRPLEMRLAGATLAEVAAATGAGVSETAATLRRARRALLALLA